MTIEQRLAESRQLVGNHASLPLDRRRFVLDTLDAALNVIVATGSVLEQRERELADLREGIPSPDEMETLRAQLIGHQTTHADLDKVIDQRETIRIERDKAIHNLCLERERLAGVRAALNDEMPPIKNARSKARGFTCSSCAWPVGTECGGAGGICVGNT